MSWLSDLFGGKEKKAVAPALKIAPTLSATAEYPLYKSTLEERMAGRGLGYDPSVLSSATAPYATQQRQGFQDYTMPTISGQASARGLGRSTIPVSQARLGSQEVESDIANRVAQLTLANEQQKAGEKSAAISGYGGLMSEDYSSLLNQVNSQNQAAMSAAAVQNYNNQMANQGSQRLLSAGVGAAEAGIGAATGNPMLILSGLSSIAGSGSNASAINNLPLSSYLALLNSGGTGAGVNILGKTGKSGGAYADELARILAYRQN